MNYSCPQFDLERAGMNTGGKPDQLGTYRIGDGIFTIRRVTHTDNIGIGQMFFLYDASDKMASYVHTQHSSRNLPQFGIEGDKAHIGEIYFFDQFRGKGLSRYMTEIVIKSFPENVKKITSGVDKRNPDKEKILAVLKNIGFKVITEGEALIELEKQL